MSLCPVCGKNTCEHTPEERGQTIKEIFRPLTPEETMLWLSRDELDPENLKMAQENAHI